MSRPEITLRSVGLAAAALLLVCGALPLAGQQVEVEARPEATDSAARAAAEELAAGYRVEELSEGVLLRPRAEGSAVRAIEIAGRGEVLVNGKPFDAAELEAFLGEDGARIARLGSLGSRELRAAFGFAVEEAEVPGDGERIELSIPGIPPVPPVPPVPRVLVRGSRDDRVSIGRSIEVGEDEQAGDVVCVGCSVDIDGVATGDVVAVGGSVDVRGTVQGDAVSIGGKVRVDDGAKVLGEAVAVGGFIDVADGGAIEGQRSSVGLGPWFGGFGDGMGFVPDSFGDVTKGVSAIFRTGVLALLGVIILLLLRPAVDRASTRAEREPWKALFAGLLLQLFFLPVLVLVTVVLAVSIIGIPLLALVPVAVLALVIGSLVGFVAIGRNFGAFLEARFGGKFSSPILTVVVGIVAIQALSLIGRVLALPGGMIAWIGLSLIAAGFFFKYAVWTIGMGSMTLVLLGRDWRRPLPPEAAAGDEPEAEPGFEETLPGEPEPDAERG